MAGDAGIVQVEQNTSFCPLEVLVTEVHPPDPLFAADQLLNRPVLAAQFAHPHALHSPLDPASDSKILSKDIVRGVMLPDVSAPRTAK